MVAAMAEQQTETLWCKASTEYSRAAEMYSYVVVTLRSQMKAAATPPAPTLNAKPTHVTKAADAKVIGQSAMMRIHQRLGQLKAAVKRTAKQDLQARAAAKAAPPPATAAQQPVISKDLVRQRQANDAACQSIKVGLQYSAADPLRIRWRESLAKDFVLGEDNVLHKVRINPDGSSRRVLVIPEGLVQAALYSCHGGYNNGHPGFLRSYQTSYERYHWSGMYADMQRHVQQGAIC